MEGMNLPQNNQNYREHNGNADDHQLHSLAQLSINSIVQKINDAYHYIHNDFKEIKAQKMKELCQEIDKLEFSYQSFSSINNDIIRLIRSIINNYTNNTINYYLRQNIVI